MGRERDRGADIFMGVFCPLYFAAVAVAKGSVTAVAFYQLVLFLIYLVELFDQQYPSAGNPYLYAGPCAE